MSDRLMTAPRLAADVMLGKLARMLRLLGYDTTYFPDMSKPQLIRLARAQDRLILTMDQELLRHEHIEVMRIHSTDAQQQLSEVTQRFPLPSEVTARCPLCNSSLTLVAEDDIPALPLPLFIRKTQSVIHYCRDCNKFFWPGSHYAHFIRFLKGGKKQGESY